jgi:RepB plasmid partitioning protein
VQEHLMIVRALDLGVPEEQLARALNVNVQHVRRRVSLLNGICSEAVTVLADKPVNTVTFDILRKMKPNRQVEACRLMTSASNISSGYARAACGQQATGPDEGCSSGARPTHGCRLDTA